MTRPTPDTAQPAREAAGEPLLSVRDLQVHYPIRSGVLRRAVGAVKAVDGVDLDVPRGTTYGLVGESGCGKSTLGRAVLRLSEPTGGSVRIAGRDLLGLGPEELRRARRQMQMVFQDPLASLDPRQTVESALVEPLAVHGVPGGPAAWRTRVRGLLDRVGLPAGAGAKYPHEFSGGQRQRVGIARALVLDPDLLVADEPVSALDVSVQAQVLVLLEELQRDLGLTYLVIAHDLAVVKHVSTTVGVMYLGGIVEEGTSSGLYARPLHPYTRALLSAAPVPDPVAEATRERILLAGDLPSPAEAASAQLSARELADVETTLASAVLGDEAEVAQRLADLVDRTGAVELMVATTLHDEAAEAEADTRLARLVARLGGGLRTAG